MPFIRPRTKQNVYLATLLVLALLTTILIPIAFGGSRWLVYESATIASFESTSVTFNDLRGVEQGLFQTCTRTPRKAECHDNVFSSGDVSPIPSCTRTGDELEVRLQGTAGLMLIAFFLSLPCSLLAMIQFKNQFNSADEKTVRCAGCSVSVSNRRTTVVRCSISGLTTFFLLLAVSLYGNTMGSWMGCGDHYCSGVVSQQQEQMNTLRIPGVRLFLDVDVNCGFGVSFAVAIMSLFASTLSTVVLGVNLVKSKKQAPSVLPPASHPPHSPATEARRSLPPETPPREVTVVPESGKPTTEERRELLPTQIPTKFMPEGDDWEYDDEAKLYWSQSQELFFDEASGHFYDPESDCWFNPQEQRWYKLS